MQYISVLMPTYNTKEEYLREAIESILNQTYEYFEFLILDDGSINNTKQVADSYKDKRIKYYYHKNIGIANTLNKGLELAKYSIIARMDADDIALPKRFEKQIEFLNLHPEISILGTNFQLYPEGKVIKKIEYPTFEDCYKYCPVAHPTVMLKKEDLNKYQYRYDSNYKCEDYELWSRAIIRLKFANLQEVLLKYRVHDNQLSQPSQVFEDSIKKVRINMNKYKKQMELL